MKREELNEVEAWFMTRIPETMSVTRNMGLALIAEIKLLRSQLHDTRDSSDPFPTVGGKEEKP